MRTPQKMAGVVRIYTGLTTKTVIERVCVGMVNFEKHLSLTMQSSVEITMKLYR